MRIKILIAISFIFATAFAGSIKESTESLIREKLGENVEIKFTKLKIPAEVRKGIQNECRQRFYKNFVYFYKIFEGDSLKRYAILDNVYGKSMPITFLVIFDLNGTIEHSGIVKYREPYGGGVRSEEWNNQFKGKDFESTYDDVSAISGATISVNSVSRGIRKLAMLISKIKPIP